MSNAGSRPGTPATAHRSKAAQSNDNGFFGALLPARFANALFAILLSGINTFVITGISIGWAFGLRAATTPSVAMSAWFHAYLNAWPVAFCLVLLFAPLVRRLVAKLTSTT
ncbi:DUF2798 domain-containing protein [Vulcanimicrobium alpinum]|uniref:DUF2798 domain-containing protein n=1 Tax=Vulcanimicrobium alpinum TaxID=3016050 RepID=UPI00386FFCA2